jgi:hypothetical protein
LINEYNNDVLPGEGLVITNEPNSKTFKAFTQKCGQFEIKDSEIASVRKLNNYETPARINGSLPDSTAPAHKAK